jgi:hypothetical protein
MLRRPTHRGAVRWTKRKSGRGGQGREEGGAGSLAHSFPQRRFPGVYWFLIALYLPSYCRAPRAVRVDHVTDPFPRSIDNHQPVNRRLSPRPRFIRASSPFHRGKLASDRVHRATCTHPSRRVPATSPRRVSRTRPDRVMEGAWVGRGVLEAAHAGSRRGRAWAPTGSTQMCPTAAPSGLTIGVRLGVLTFREGLTWLRGRGGRPPELNSKWWRRERDSNSRGLAP